MKPQNNWINADLAPTYRLVSNGLLADISLKKKKREQKSSLFTNLNDF